MAPAAAAPQIRPRDSLLLRVGRYAWAFIGLVLVALVLLRVASWVSLVLIPLLLALFPAALLSPLNSWLKRHGVPHALAAILLILSIAGVLTGLMFVVVPRVQAELPALVDKFAEGTTELQVFIARVLPLDLNEVGELPRRALTALGGPEALVGQGLAAAQLIVDVVAGLLLFIVALFFYFKDGPAIWRGIADLLPEKQREQVDEVAGHVWWTLGAYLRGQLLVALVDGVFIGLGLWMLDVPLPLVLGVLTFFGGLFPIVGAFVSGLVAVVVALADSGVTTALLVLGLVLLVQQLEGNVLEPLIMSRIVALHPLLILFSVTAGALILGVLGAFLAVPLTAALARIVDFARGRPPAAGPKEATTSPVAAVVTGDVSAADEPGGDSWSDHGTEEKPARPPAG